MSVLAASSSTAWPSTSWLEQAACRGRDPSWWFAPTGSFEQSVAVRICAGCPSRGPCLDDALRLEDDHRFGVRGGTTPAQRRVLAHHRQLAG